MFRKVLLTIGLLLIAQMAVFAQGTMKGKITDAKNGEALIGANVVAKQDGQIMGGARTDLDGNYTIKGLQVGKYEIEVSYVGYTTVKTEINVKASGFTVYNESLEKSGGVQMKTVVVKTQKVPVIDIGAPESGTRLSADDIGKMPANSVDGIVAAVAGVGYSDGGTGSARGEDGMVTQVGGVRTRTGVNVPKEAIAEIQVVLGGTPASIGEAIGGTQIITLKPPSTKFQGLLKYETYLDYRLSNSLVVYLTGPVAMTGIKDDEGKVTGKRTLIGFRFTGTGSYTKFGYYRPKDGRYQIVNDDRVMEIEQKPIDFDPVTNTVNYTAEYLRGSDFVEITRPNARNYYSKNRSKDDIADFGRYSIALQGALDFRFTELTSLVLTGEFDYSYAPSTSLSYFPLNLHNAANGVQKYQNFVLTADFTQRFKDPEPEKDPSNPDAKVEPAVSKVMYNITAMFNREKSRSFNEKFGDDIFKYGHIATFQRSQSPSYEFVSNYNYRGTEQPAYVQNGWIETVTGFEASPYNPILSNYTGQLYNTPTLVPYLTTFDNILQFNGLVNGTSLPSVYGLFSNVGVQSSSYAKQENNYYYVQAKAAATIKGHDLEIGFQYDQYTSSYYGVSAYSLWNLMRNNANAHISQLNYNRPIERFDGSNLYVDYERLISGQQTHFSESMRNALGLDVNGTDWLDVDRYEPSFYSIDMFSANELFNSGNQYVSYFGYDHTGKKYSSSTWSLDDFFDPASKGHKDYQYLPAFSPIYAAGYIQDKFYFQDLIFNVGVRVDYFDGNQMVLKDPYLLYESYTVGDLRKSGHPAFSTGLEGNAFPGGVQDDWVVYVDDASSDNPTIKGYRGGTYWYDKYGVQVSAASEIKGESGHPTPFRTKGNGGGQETATTGNGSGNNISSASFKDYEPQIVVMPRIAFSFPVNDMSQFKANYDIIARRPSSGWQADYLSYLYMNRVNGTISNPNLKPERITNYELGFQQALNKDKTAALSISAYYKETRDLIQVVQYEGADPKDGYFSYDNIDFKTIKGFSLSFDMRQSQNVRINANYTLQYAEGTGLTNTTMTELIKEGYTTLKMLNPIADDRRHEFKANVDYRLGDKEGWHYTRTVKDKDGNPRKKDVYPFQNLGFNFLAVAQSGRPYTRQFSNTQQTIVGSYRGARLPWGFYFNVVVDKTWPIEVKAGGRKRPTMLNAAITVNNLFDIRNVTGVWSVTGNPSDNGYLTDPETQSVINQYLDPQSFRDMYAIMLANGNWNWSSPRTIRVTLSYSF
ncbi:MAG: TonB-dependent receptor [Bacteroidales bacterium]|nr:TonB-dependent receptor [Bacteroidales bacterium]